MALLILFLIFVGGSFLATLMPVTRTITVAIRDAFEPIQLPAVVPTKAPAVDPMAETMTGLAFDDALAIGPADQLREAA